MVRPAAHFFLIGAALLALRLGASALAPAAPPRLRVAVSAGADDDERRRAVERAVLLEEAVRRGWLETDPVIRRRLVQNVRFAAGRSEGDAPPSAAEEVRLLRAAVALGMHRTDPVVRGRLDERVVRIAAARSRRSPPDDEELRAYLEAHPDRFERPARFDLEQVFLSRDLRGDAVEGDALALSARLAEAPPEPPSAAARLGDPLPFSLARGAVSAASLDRRLGEGFGGAVTAAPLRRWTGPLASAYGLHFVFVRQVSPGGPPDLDAVRDQVSRLILAERLPRERAALAAELRAAYDVVLVAEEDGS